MKLSKKQEAFVYEYLKDFNATRAYIRAGYKFKNENVARVQAHKLLTKPNIQKKIQEELNRRKQEHLATAENVIKELSSIAFSDIFNLIDINDDRIIYLKNKNDLKEIDRKAVQSISYDSRTGSLKIRMHDKLKALELIGKHLGLFEGEKPDVEQLNKLKEIIEGLKDAIKE